MENPMNRFTPKCRAWLARLALLGTALILAACSTVTVGYNNAGKLLGFQANRYLGLTPAQRDVLSVQWSRFEAWHRREVLPVYADTLQAWAGRLDESRAFTVAEVLDKQAWLVAEAQRLGDRAAQELAPLLVTLTAHQRATLLARFEASNREYARDFLDRVPVGLALDRRFDRVGKRYEQWLGSLTQTQQARLREWLASTPEQPALWAAERQARQQALLSLLEKHAGQPVPAAQQALASYFDGLQRGWLPDFVAQRPQQRERWAQATADVLNGMTPAQRRHLQNRLRKWASDFDELSQPAPGRSASLPTG
jgi:hypothetical protein